MNLQPSCSRWPQNLSDTIVDNQVDSGRGGGGGNQDSIKLVDQVLEKMCSNQMVDSAQEDTYRDKDFQWPLARDVQAIITKGAWLAGWLGTAWDELLELLSLTLGHFVYTWSIILWLISQQSLSCIDKSHRHSRPKSWSAWVKVLLFFF